MTAEEKREQILKRILPALFISVIYYVFILDTIAEPAKKAESTFLDLQKQGVSTEGVDNKIQQKEKLDDEINRLQSKVNSFKAKLDKMAGFLSNGTPSNESTVNLAKILDQYQLRVIEEQNKPYLTDALPPALKEVETLINTGANKEESINAQHILLSGNYLSIYQAMNEIASGRLKAIPIVFNLIPASKENKDETFAEQPHWELILWM